ncbi:MAG: HlyD family efflux transporter periplasmic adaptor subunit [Geobacter sp.]|nr:HlyD family efflux transporter periplasmic adaptor subunit [Geobacter sp.]
MEKKWIIAGVAAIAVIGAVALAVSLLYRKPASDSIKVSGNIEITVTELSFKVPGRVRERLVDEGETVRAGQLVARLDEQDLANEVALRQAQVEAARQVLAELEAGSRREEIGQAEAALSGAEAEERRAADDFSRQSALFEREVISKQKYDAAKAAFETARAHAREVREALALVRKGPRRERIEQGRAKLREAEQALNEAQLRLGYANLTSPVNGLVMAKHVEPGEQVNIGTSVVTIGNFGDTWMRAYIPETELGRIRVGQKVRITTDTWPDRLYEGTITFISGEAEFTPKNVQTEKERVKLVYRIKIAIPNPKMELKPGMPADGEILAGTGDWDPTGPKGLGTGK